MSQSLLEGVLLAGPPLTTAQSRKTCTSSTICWNEEDRLFDAHWTFSSEERTVKSRDSDDIASVCVRDT